MKTAEVQCCDSRYHVERIKHMCLRPEKLDSANPPHPLLPSPFSGIADYCSTVVLYHPDEPSTRKGKGGYEH
jgi:hypothetical protein